MSSPGPDDHDRAAALVGVAFALGGADDERQVLRVVAERLGPLLAAHTAGLLLREPGGTSVRALSRDLTRTPAREDVTRLDADDDQPAVQVAVTGTAAFTPGGAAVPLGVPGAVLGSLLVLRDRPDWPDADRELLTAVAAVTAQALERLTARAGERTARAAGESAHARAEVSSERLRLVNAVSDLFARHADPAPPTTSSASSPGSSSPPWPTGAPSPSPRSVAYGGPSDGRTPTPHWRRPSPATRRCRRPR